MAHVTTAIRKNSFAMYFKCDNSTNCVAISRDGSAVSEAIEDGAHFSIREIGGRRAIIELRGKSIETDRVMTLTDAKGLKHWMSPYETPAQRVNILPAPVKE